MVKSLIHRAQVKFPCKRKRLSLYGRHRSFTQHPKLFFLNARARGRAQAGARIKEWRRRARGISATLAFKLHFSGQPRAPWIVQLPVKGREGPRIWTRGSSSPRASWCEMGVFYVKSQPEGSAHEPGWVWFVWHVFDQLRIVHLKNRAEKSVFVEPIENYTIPKNREIYCDIPLGLKVKVEPCSRASTKVFGKAFICAITNSMPFYFLFRDSPHSLPAPSKVVFTLWLYNFQNWIFPCFPLVGSGI